MIAPDGFENWNPALRGAYRKGYEAGVAGAPRTAPYLDKRTPRGRLTWSRSFETAWHDGWGAGDQWRQREARQAPSEGQIGAGSPPQQNRG